MSSNSVDHIASVTDVRSGLIDFVCADLVGPAHGLNEVLEDPPYVKYAAGVLFPSETRADESGSFGGVEASGGDRDEGVLEDDIVVSTAEPSEEIASSDTDEPEIYDDLVTLANQYKPSALALTFIVPEAARQLRIVCDAAEYVSGTRPSRDGRRQNQVWERKEILIEPLEVILPNEGTEHYIVTPGLGFCICTKWNNGRRIITASMFNESGHGDSKVKTFYQCGFTLSCINPSSDFAEYSNYEGELDLDDEELSLQMLYRNQRTFAIGHGCGADWTLSERGGASSLCTKSIPRVVVPQIEPRASEHRYLNMKFLQGGMDYADSDIPKELKELCTDYERWIEAKEEFAAQNLPDRYVQAANVNLSLCRIALNRIRRGVEMIESDPIAMDAFKLANRAILMQQYHSRLPGRSLDDSPAILPVWGDYREGYWRTFQIAFILMAIPGIVDEADTIRLNNQEINTRDLVDLIWFPTGGGKTEAYLGLSAFLIFLNRLRDPRADGCKVLMRYTLRLLTSQQFQRACSLICACELIRGRDPARLGSVPISIGLWVGRSLTPNDERSASRAVDGLLKPGEGRNPFQLLSCPWCGTALNDKRKLGYVIYRRQQRFVCPNSGGTESACSFSSEMNPLPVCVVDESIYARPPTLLIGTVDKFAILAWRDRAGEIFQVGGGPKLIIQDELHLISGPLGSIVGLYESVIDFLCSRNGRPKVIASTATIRRARDQCKNLYSRPMFQFPPAGLEATDSYFAVENPDAPGRLYAGFMPTASSSGLTAQIRGVAALQQGLFLTAGDSPDKWVDPYYTLVQYFSSLKELGRAATFVKADIPEFLPTMHRSYGLSGSDTPDRRRYLHTSEELTSRQNEEEIPKILARLELNYDSSKRFDSQALDTILATNMISVGVDVDRLGLMMIVTQPKGTSEYIQASSRVGRSVKAPGLVFTLYNAGRPRDRSHYEQFRPYHDAFYRFVEPTSVTPFSPPALERALHAVLVIAGRQIAGWTKPNLDRSDEKFSEFLSFLEKRVHHIDPDHMQEYESILERRLDEWEGTSAEAWGDIMQRSDRVVLMRPAGQPADEAKADCWEVPTSMRNVDITCGVSVVRSWA